MSGYPACPAWKANSRRHRFAIAPRSFRLVSSPVICSVSSERSVALVWLAQQVDGGPDAGLQPDRRTARCDGSYRRVNDWVVAS